MKHAAFRIALLVLLGGVAGLAPRAARADARLTSLPAELRAGESVELSWAEVPRAEEAELLLSLDDGRHWTVRVSPQLDAHEHRWVWRVPDLAAASARIGLRAGTAHDERLVAISTPFRIAPAHANPAALGAEHAPMIVEGTLWSGFPAASGPRAASLAPGTPRFELAAASSPAEPPVTGRMRFTLRGVRAPLSSEKSAAPPNASPRASAPLEVPLRV